MNTFARLLALLAVALFLAGGAPAALAGPITLAQSAEDESYLPPWQGDQSEAPAEGGDIGSREGRAPRDLRPPRSRTQDGDRDDLERRRARRDHDARRYEDRQYRDDRGPARRDREYYDESEDFTTDEILSAGHRFFGNVTEGLAEVIEYAFSRYGYPNGYILGEEAGGAFVAGLRYGEGMLYTKHIGRHKVFWQGPSVGYDFGADGSKTMILVYDIQHPGELYHRFGGIDGSAYVVGGVGITFQSHKDVVLAPIRSGVGLRLGANIGYLKYTREPTWNPF